MQFFGADEQDLFRFNNVRVRQTAVNRTDCLARFLVVKADTFCTFLWNDIKKVLGYCGMHFPVEFPLNVTLIDSRVGAFGLTRTAIDALIRNRRSHPERFSLHNLMHYIDYSSSSSNGFPWSGQRDQIWLFAY